MDVILTIMALVVMEGLLSFDNALVLAALVKHLKGSQQKKALTYGIGGAFVFRILSLCLLTQVMQSDWIRMIGGAYLVFLAVKHFLTQESEEGNAQATQKEFWKTVVTVELADVMFSLDSILAAVALSQKLWIVIVGGLLGIVMMRFAASLFIQLIEKFPGFERTGFLLVLLVGCKLIGSVRINFDSGIFHAGFWILFGLAIVTGFISDKKAVDSPIEVQ